MGSPSVTIKERVLETLPVVNGNFTCVLIGTASKGDLEKITYVPSFTIFREYFGNKIDTNEKTYFAIKKLYENTSNIYFARVGNSSSMASASKTITWDDPNVSGVSMDVLTFTALEQGTYGNNIKIEFLKLLSATGEPQGYTIYVYYNGFKEEEYKNVNITDPTSERYIEKIINEETSQYITVDVNDTFPSGYDINSVDIASGTTVTLEGGNDGDDQTEMSAVYTSVMSVLEKLKDRDTYTFDTILYPDFQEHSIDQAMQEVVNFRNDFLGLIDFPQGIGIGGGPTSDPINDANAYVDSYDNKQIAVAGFWQKDYDSTDKVYKWFPMSIYIADILAKLARNSVMWMSIAGFDNGKLGTVETQYSPSKGERDKLYGEDPSGAVHVVNPVVDFETDGIVLFGQRTTLRNNLKPTNRINVVVMLNFLKQKLYKLGRRLQFRINSPNSGLEQDFINGITPVLNYIKANQGAEDCQIVADETVNTPIVRANNKFIGKITITPASVAEDIEFILEVTPQTVEIQKS